MRRAGHAHGDLRGRGTRFSDALRQHPAHPPRRDRRQPAARLSRARPAAAARIDLADVGASVPDARRSDSCAAQNPPHELRKFTTLHNADQIIRTFFDPRPTVVVCGHYGNFELSAYMLGLLGFPTYTIARPLDNPFLDRFLNEFRGLTGQHMLPKNGSTGQVEGVLAAGGILALLADQYAGPKGCWVEFFGRPASSHKAIALFTLGSDAPTMFCFARRTGPPLSILLGTYSVLDPLKTPSEKLNVTAITQWYTRQLEHTIRQAPEQYWWLHRRWKDTRPKKPAAAPSKAA